jgi:putative aldouronate transport system permease protein
VIDSNFILSGLKNSAFLVIVGGGLSLAFTTLAAYPLSKKYLPYRKTLTYFVYIPMVIGGGLIPSFLLVKFLGLYGSLWSCVLAGLVSPWYVFLMRNFFFEIPDSIEEAAQLDGCNEAQILLRVLLPISMPVLATIGLFYVVGQWNSWFTPSLYLRSKEQWPLQLGVKDLLTNFDWSKSDNVQNMEQLLKNLPTENVKKAAVFITSIPVLLFYPFAQKYFVTGLVMGSVKG